MVTFIISQKQKSVKDHKKRSKPGRVVKRLRLLEWAKNLFKLFKAPIKSSIARIIKAAIINGIAKIRQTSNQVSTQTNQLPSKHLSQGLQIGMPRVGESQILCCVHSDIA